MNQLDHIVIAAADLDAAIAQFADETGCVPSPGGSHRGLGTKNTLTSFGSDCYLELIAPDPAQQLKGTFGEMLLQLPQPQPLHWAIRTMHDGLQRLISQTKGVQCTAGDALLSLCFTGDKGEFHYRATSPTGFKL